MAKAKKLPSGSWRVQIYCGQDENGKDIRVSFTAETKKEAEKQAALFNGDRKQLEADRKAGRIKLSQAVSEYIETCRATGKSPATIQNYTSYARHIGPEMNLYITELDQRTIQRMINRWAKTWAPGTIKVRFALVASALEAAGIDTRWRSLHLPKEDKPEITIPQDEDIQRLLTYLEKQGGNLYIAVLLASTLGLRRSEICALEWSDVDFEKKTLSVSKAMVYGDDHRWHVKAPKSKSGYRVLDIQDDVLAILKKYRNLSGRIVSVYPSSLTEHYKRVCTELGIPGSFHTLRHYMASVMAALNIPEKSAVDIMGHASPAMLHQVYQHTLEKVRNESFEKIGSHTAQLVHGEEISY